MENCGIVCRKRIKPKIINIDHWQGSKSDISREPASLQRICWHFFYHVRATFLLWLCENSKQLRSVEKLQIVGFGLLLAYFEGFWRYNVSKKYWWVEDFSNKKFYVSTQLLFELVLKTFITNAKPVTKKIKKSTDISAKWDFSILVKLNPLLEHSQASIHRYYVSNVVVCFT